MDLTAQLLAKADAYCARTGLSKATLASKVARDGKFFDRIGRGSTLTVKMYERFMAFFADQDAQVAADQDRGADQAEIGGVGSGAGQQPRPEAA